MTDPTIAPSDPISPQRPGAGEQKGQICATCRFWQEVNSTNGRCRRYAPQSTAAPFRQTESQSADWPFTYTTDWCGEHEPSALIAPNQGPEGGNR